jgi:hypothetical protein
MTGLLGWLHIVDDEMEVERKMCGQGVARLLVLGPSDPPEG